MFEGQPFKTMTVPTKKMPGKVAGIFMWATKKLSLFRLYIGDYTTQLYGDCYKPL